MDTAFQRVEVGEQGLVVLMGTCPSWLCLEGLPATAVPPGGLAAGAWSDAGRHVAAALLSLDGLDEDRALAAAFELRRRLPRGARLLVLATPESATAAARLHVHAFRDLVPWGMTLGAALARAPRESPYWAPLPVPGPDDHPLASAALWLLADSLFRASLEDLAVRLGVSDRTLRRNLSEATGSTLREIARDGKLELGAALLDARLPARSVAKALGYSSTSALCHAVRNAAGCSPVEWIGRLTGRAAERASSNVRPAIAFAGRVPHRALRAVDSTLRRVEEPSPSASRA